MTIGNGGGSREARFDAIYRKYFGRIYRLFRRSRVSDDEAQDLAQDTFKRFYQAMEKYRGDSEWGFLETIALNVLRNWVRARKTGKRNAVVVELDAPDFNNEPPAPEEPDYAVRQEESINRQRLHGAIDELSPGQQECMKLWLADLEYDQIAKTLRISMDAVKSRLRDAKRILSARLGDHLREEEE